VGKASFGANIFANALHTLRDILTFPIFVWNKTLQWSGSPPHLS